ncbi:YceD family protein [Antarctobacter jejuensis]|uniref:YceD family protein n=1 Tax=Antarctobacter jejuensis TaxID=1439938 RepID=UPI003FD28E5F
MTTPSPQGPLTAPRLRVSSLRQSGKTPVRLEPDAGTRAALAQELGAVSIKKLRFEGVLTPLGKRGWRLQGQLGATVVQSCIVTLEPVTTRIDTEVLREFVPQEMLDEPEAGSEIEMPEDDSVEPLGEEIDVEAVMTEALSLALPTYPRKDGVELGEAQFAEDGVAPLTDEAARPFAGLAALREKMQEGDEED